MISPTNFHIPSVAAEALAAYHLGSDHSALPSILDPVLDQLTDPDRHITVETVVYGGHLMLLADDHDSPARTIGLGR